MESGRGSLMVKVSDRGWLATSSIPVPLKTRRSWLEIYANLQSLKTPTIISDKVPHRFVANVESSVSSGSEYQLSSLEENGPRLDQSQDFRSSESGFRQEQYKKTRQDVMRYKKKVPASRSAGPERKKNRRSIRETNKRALMSFSASTKQVKKKVKRELWAGSSRRFKTRSRRRVASVKPGSARNVKPKPPKQKRRHQESRSPPSGRAVQAQGVPVWSRREPFREPKKQKVNIYIGDVKEKNFS
ncbi:hypothetical protein TNCV_1155271 [Trichonephila clavipes]|nr:hypothetical protein TNCV_1155271 [Trichonephila clavipes]